MPTLMGISMLLITPMQQHTWSPSSPSTLPFSPRSHVTIRKGTSLKTSVFETCSYAMIRKGTSLKTSVCWVFLSTSPQTSNSLCHNCPIHLSHKFPIPIFPLCYTSCVCRNIMNIDVPATVGALPLYTQLPSSLSPPFSLFYFGNVEHAPRST